MDNLINGLREINLNDEEITFKNFIQGKIAAN